MFDFPASPTLGATYQVGGKSYVYDGEKWRNAPSSMPPAKTAQALNRVVNGAMQISQENPKNAGLTAVSAYVADQWAVSFSTTGTPGFICYDNVSSGDDEVNSFIRMNVTAADTSLTTTEVYRLFTVIEASGIADFKWGSAQAKPAVLRFRARSTIVGTFAVNLREYGSTCVFIKHCTFTAANTWQTFAIPVPACTIGTWATGTAGALVLQFLIASGSTTYGTDNAWNATGSLNIAGAITNWMSATGQNFEVANVGLYLDPDNTGLAPPFQTPDYAQELIRCKRYWQRMMNMYSGDVTSGNTYYAHGYWSVEPRIAPTLTGTVAGQGGFPAAVGTLTNMAGGMWESRVSNSSSAGIFDTMITANARM